MSVLNPSEDESKECPLCMEPFDIDDNKFFPCACMYQICRFCWHRIRTDENGLCPACRKAYKDDPVLFKPLTKEEFQKFVDSFFILKIFFINKKFFKYINLHL